MGCIIVSHFVASRLEWPLALALVFMLSLSFVSPVSSAPASNYLPPFSIYGTPTIPSSQTTLNMTGSYWGPYLKEIYWTWFTTTEAQIEALVNGAIQFIDSPVASTSEYSQLLSYENSGTIAMNITPAPYWYYIVFNYHVFPFDNTHFRQGIQRLINYQTLSSLLDGGVLGLATPYYAPPQIFGSYFNPGQAEAYREYGSYNLTAAIQDFEAAGLVDHSSQGYWSFQNGTKASFYLVLSPGPGFELYQAIMSSIYNDAAAINLSISTQLIAPGTFGSYLASGQWQMALGEWIWSPPSPTEFYLFLGPSALNKGVFDYSNATAWRLLSEVEYDSATNAEALNYTHQALTFLQTDLPYVTLFWGTTLFPVSTVGWQGYIVEPPYGTLLPGNVHPANSTFGAIYHVAALGTVDDMNILNYLSAQDDIIFGSQFVSALGIPYNNPVGYMANAAENWTVSSGSGTMPNGESYNGTTITFNFLPNFIWGDGVPLTAEDFNFTLWYYDVGGYSSNPYNPSDSNISIAPGITLDYTAVSQHPSTVWFDSAPGFVGSYVTPSNPYHITLYFNTTSVFNLYNVFGLSILPMHTLGKVQPAVADQMTNPSQYLPYFVPAGPYGFSGWSQTNDYEIERYLPEYALSNPYTNQIQAQLGGTATFSVNVNVYNTTKVISNSTGYFAIYNQVDNAAGTLYVLNPTNQQLIESMPMRGGAGGEYFASIPTQNLGAGSYLLVAKLNWTGSPYMFYTTSSTNADTYYYQSYGILNVTSPSSTSHTPTSSSSSTGIAPTTSSSSSPTPTTTRPSSDVTEIAAVAVVIVIVIVAIAALAMRRKK